MSFNPRKGEGISFKKKPRVIVAQPTGDEGACSHKPLWEVLQYILEPFFFETAAEDRKARPRVLTDGQVGPYEDRSRVACERTGVLFVPMPCRLGGAADPWNE